MIITNKNADKESLDKHIKDFQDFVRGIVSSQKNNLKNVPQECVLFESGKWYSSPNEQSIGIMDYPHYSNILYAIDTIPIYLDKIETKGKKENSKIDTLGAYYPEYSPYIIIDWNKIQDKENEDDTSFKYLFTSVLLHEMAHAILDEDNYAFNNKYVDGYEKVNKLNYTDKTDPFGHDIEEAMANAVALRVMRESQDGNLFDYATTFISNQGEDGYKQGVKLEKTGFIKIPEYVYSKKIGIPDDTKKLWNGLIHGF